MKPKVINDYRDTQRGPCLVIGNGPSLNDVPKEFVATIPSFGCNFLPMYAPGTPLDYLVMTDKITMKNENLWGYILTDTLVLCYGKWAGEVMVDYDVVWWVNKDDLIPGFTTSDKWGQYFPTSAHAACWMADLMGFDEIYLVGMDGTSQVGSLEGTDGQGKSNVPHFYDPHPGKNSMLWDIAWGNMAHFLGKKGKPLINLSIETAITQLPRRNLYDFYKPDLGCWVWPGDSKRAGQVIIRASSLLNEYVAGAPPHIAGALDRLGYLVVATSPTGRVRYWVTDPSEQKDLDILQEYIFGGRV